MTPSSTSGSARARAGRLAIATVAAGIAAVAALTGCSAGQITQTSTQVAPVPGTNVDVGQVALRNLVIAYPGPDGYPAGGDAPLVVRLFNKGTTPVTLVGVSADKAQSVSLVGTPEVVTTTEAPPPPPETPATTPTSPQPTSSESATSPQPSVTVSPTAAPTTEPPGTPVSITIPPGSFVLLVQGQASSGYLRLTGLTEAIVPGESVAVTFTFSDGTSATVPVPLAPPTSAVPRGTPVVDAGHAEG